MGTKKLKKIHLHHFKFSYNMLLSFEDAIFNNNSKSHISELQLGDCTYVDECRCTVDVLHHITTKSTITKLALESKNEMILPFSNLYLLGMLAKESNLLVLDLVYTKAAVYRDEIMMVDNVEDMDIEDNVHGNEKDVSIDKSGEEESSAEEYNNNEGLISEFLKTLSMNRTL